MQFIKKTSSRISIMGLIIKISLVLIAILVIIFLLNKVDFPAPSKDIEKKISNENFKVVR
jgi:hypothetical protein